MRSIMKFAAAAVSALLLILLFAFYTRAVSYRDGFDRREVMIGGSIPAQVYLPDTEKPPVVIVAHGFTADKEIMQSLAYSLVRDGFAVVTFDFRGHGENTTDFDQNRLGEDMERVVDFARNLNENMPRSFTNYRPQEVDTGRIALMGHSMGGGAVVRYALRDRGIDATVPISGVGVRITEGRPKNLFIIYAENDPPDLRQAAWQMLRDGTDEEILAADTTYGSFTWKTARRLSVVGNTDHITILFSGEAHERMLDWLHQVWELPQREKEVSDPRLAWMGWMYLLAFVLFFGCCYGLSWYLPEVSQRPGREVALNLIFFAVVCFVTLFVILLAPPLSFITMPVGSYLISYFFVVGIIYFLVALRRGTIDFSHFSNPGRAVFASLALFFFVYLTFGAIATETWFRQFFTAQRLLWALALLPLLLPYFLAFEGSFKRGNTFVALIASLVGVFIALGMLVVGVRLGVTGDFIMLIIIPMVAYNVVFQLFAAHIYHLSGNYFITALFNSLLMAWQYAVLFPIS